MKKTQLVRAFALAGVIASSGCAHSGSKGPELAKQAPEPGTLALTVRYTTLCFDNRANGACPSVEYPEVCWSGACAENCGNDGALSFQRCAPGGVRTDDPFAIEQTASERGLASGTWQIHARSPSWFMQCPAQVGQTDGVVIDSAQRSCI